MRKYLINTPIVAMAVLLAVPGVSTTWAQQEPTKPVASKTASQHYNDGVVAYQHSKFDDAIAAFTSALSVRTSAPYADAYFARGVCYSRKKEYTKAVTDFTNALNVKPRLVEAYLERASAHAAMRKYSEALADYALAEQKGADKNLVLQFRGSMYFTMKEYDKAIVDWTAYVAAVPNTSAAIHYNLGLAYLEKKDADKAIVSFTNALLQRPTYAAAFKGRAEAYLSMEPKEYAKAKTDAEAAIRVGGNDPEARRLLEQANAGLGLN
jgi:tetratricopeptide (TPR) repeat protein